MYWLQNRPWIFEPADFSAAAAELTGLGWPEEFCFAHPLDALMVDAACLAGFLPMSMNLAAPLGFGLGVQPELLMADDLSYAQLASAQTRLETAAAVIAAWNSRGAEADMADMVEYCFFTPKLHTLRCVLAPDQLRVGRSCRKQAAAYSFSVNSAFDQVMAGCVQTHGDAWLTLPLRTVFRQLQRQPQAGSPVRFLSIELWRDAELVAGELGYQIGAVYTSLSGFRTASGSGTIQMAALGAWLHGQGIRLWDLGMPVDYKTRLGARLVERPVYQAEFFVLYNTPVRLDVCTREAACSLLAAY